MKHLLVVDDEVGPRESLRAVFTGRYEVSLAGDADEAMAILNSKPVDLVLLDVIMPRKDGVSVLKEIQARYPGVPVVMISASNSVRPVVEAMRVGAYDYLSKPFDVQEIQHVVSRALASTSMQRR